MNWLEDVCTGFVAALLVVLADRCVCAGIRKRLAGKFVGEYEMFEGNSPCRGSVIIEYKLGWQDFFLGSSPELSVIADHKTGANPGTEDWTAPVVIHGSNTASGFYMHQDRAGGELLLTRLEGGRIVEYGSPHERAAKSFIRTLRPKDKRLISG
jgi:hypothetical protein